MKQLSSYPWLNWYVGMIRSIPVSTFRWRFTPDQSSHETEIRLSAFSIGATPVTWGMWKEYSVDTGIKMPVMPRWGYLDDHPVVNIGYDEIMNPIGFCSWASSVVGFKLALPTIAQWECAARGGQNESRFPWGNEFEMSNIWCSQDPSVGMTAPVLRSSNIFCNDYGLFDMAGNVSQWCIDFHNPGYYPCGINPVDERPNKYDDRCVRGIAWDVNPVVGTMTVELRHWNHPENGGSLGTGFRLSA